MISLNYRDARPIYEQVRDGLRQLMVSGAIQPGEKLPSVRTMAATLAINPNTIQRAYAALEQEGYLSVETGKGVFAARSQEQENPRRGVLLRQFDQVSQELVFLGFSRQELARRVSQATEKGGAGA